MMIHQHMEQFNTTANSLWTEAKAIGLSYFIGRANIIFLSYVSRFYVRILGHWFSLYFASVISKGNNAGTT